MSSPHSLQSRDVATFRDGCLLAGFDADRIEVRVDGTSPPPGCSGCVICIVHGEYALSFLAAADTDWPTRALRAVWEGRCGPRVRKTAPNG